MTNPVLTNTIATENVILWQYDKAYNLIRLIQKWNQFATASCKKFWDYIGNNVFPIDRANTYGLNVWGNILGIPRPTIRVPKSGINYDNKTNVVTNPDWVSKSDSDTADIDSLIQDGYIKYKTENGIVYLYKPVEDGSITYDMFGFDENGYRVIETEEDSDWKTVTIQNTLYRGLLKGRFFLMGHPPTVTNYNKYLAIVFGTKNNKYDTFTPEGDVKKSDSTRNHVIDMQNMSMGFTFPKKASTEEAYLIFQHYDVVYPFPAGIRYPGEFIDYQKVIGLNNGNGDGATGQFYKNFVDGLVLAEDDSGNANGGIFSNTNRANYFDNPKVNGTVYIVQATAGDAKSIELSNENSNLSKVWIDWGDGDCGTCYIPANSTTIFPREPNGYTQNGVYAVTVLMPENVTITQPPSNVDTTYTLNAG